MPTVSSSRKPNNTTTNSSPKDEGTPKSMSVPVDLVEDQMQRMIALQNEQQRLLREVSQDVDPSNARITGTNEFDKVRVLPTTITRKSLISNNDDNNGTMMLSVNGLPPQSYRGHEPTTSYENSPNIGQPDYTMVGKGTLTWNLNDTTTLRPPSLMNNIPIQQQQQQNMQNKFPNYGGTNEQEPLDPNIVPFPPGQHHRHYHSQRVEQYHDRYPDNTSINVIEYRDPYAPSDHITTLVEDQTRRYQYRNNNSFSCCCCLWEPLCRSVQDFINAEALHRSFCYGAIDGMLTGAGIVSTFSGMNMLRLTSDNTYSSEIRALVVVFTAATCFADSVCMALGHIWTTHVLAAAQARERSDARVQLIMHKADAKGMLVDMLLQKGMLKIDAMSVADTLDGYPDLFVSALTGESITAPATHQQNNNNISNRNTPPSFDSIPNYVGGQDDIVVATDSATNGAETNVIDNPQRHTKTQTATTSSYHHHHGGYTPTYSNVYHYSNDYLDNVDPDMVVVTSANRESRRESFFMMMGFSLFSVIPSLIYTMVPSLMMLLHINTAGLQQQTETDHLNETINTLSTSLSPSTTTSALSHGADTIFMDPNTLAILLTCCTMWWLGVWKSRFLDSNWLVFGTETVCVLLVCIVCAYVLGALLNHLFLPNEYQITVITPPTKASAETAITVTSTKIIHLAARTASQHQHQNNGNV